jgi:hypothetical protein
MSVTFITSAPRKMISEIGRWREGRKEGGKGRYFVIFQSHPSMVDFDASGGRRYAADDQV